MNNKFEKEAIDRYLEIQRINYDLDMISINDDKRFIKSAVRVLGALIVKMSDPKNSGISTDMFNNIRCYAEKITGLLNQVYIDYDLKESAAKHKYQCAISRYVKEKKK